MQEMHFWMFTVQADIHPYWVSFKAYHIEGITEDWGLLYHKAGADSYPDPVDTTAESEIYLHGDVKWDGCSNWHFDEQDRCMLHGCNRDDLVRLGAIMAACWDWAKELLEK